MRLNEISEYMSLKAKLNVKKGYGNKSEVVGETLLKGKFAIMSGESFTFVGFIGDNPEPKIMRVILTNDASHIVRNQTSFDTQAVFVNYRDFERTRFPQDISNALDSVARKLNKNYRIQKNIEIEKSKLEHNKQTISNTFGRIEDKKSETSDFVSLDLSTKADMLTKKLDNAPKGNDMNLVRVSENLTEETLTISTKLKFLAYDYLYTDTGYTEDVDMDGYTRIYTKLRGKTSLTKATIKFIELNNSDSEALPKVINCINALKKYKPQLELENYRVSIATININVTIKEKDLTEDKLKELTDIVTKLLSVDLDEY